MPLNSISFCFNEYQNKPVMFQVVLHKKLDKNGNIEGKSSSVAAIDYFSNQLIE